MVWDIITNGLSVTDVLIISLRMSNAKYFVILTNEMHNAVLDRDVAADDVGHDLTPREIARAAIRARFHLETWAGTQRERNSNLCIRS